MTMPADQGKAGHAEDGSGESWTGGAAKGALLLALSFAGFVWIPNRLVGYLSLHVAPRGRDALVLLWIGIFFVFMSWLFVRLQRAR
jgi:hypothetical protein